MKQAPATSFAQPGDDEFVESLDHFIVFLGRTLECGSKERRGDKEASPGILTGTAIPCRSLQDFPERVLASDLSIGELKQVDPAYF
jgi:hypothetical protein